MTLGLSLAYGFQQLQKISNKEQKSKKEKHPTSGYSQTFCNLLPREELVMWRGKTDGTWNYWCTTFSSMLDPREFQCSARHFRVKFNRLQISSIPFDSKFNSNQPWVRGELFEFMTEENTSKTKAKKEKVTRRKRKQPFRKHMIQHRKARRCVPPPVRTVSLGV